MQQVAEIMKKILGRQELIASLRTVVDLRQRKIKAKNYEG
jgi:hypothetical protein